MAHYSVDLYEDLPNPHKRKRVVFYCCGLKIYGHIPHLLKRRLKGEFLSNYWIHDSGAFRGHGIIAPTGEQNYTAIPYGQSPENARRLWDWLHEEAGFEWAIAGLQDYGVNIFEGNVAQWPPETWVPEMRAEEFIQRFLGGGNAKLP
jgi:hypothetical protein